MQQAVEKTWKGRLVLLGIRPPAVHDLRALLQARGPEGRASSDLASLIEGLQPFAVEERYPLLSPRDATRPEFLPLIPLVEAELAELRRDLGNDEP